MDKPSRPRRRIIAMGNQLGKASTQLAIAQDMAEEIISEIQEAKQLADHPESHRDMPTQIIRLRKALRQMVAIAETWALPQIEAFLNPSDMPPCPVVEKAATGVKV